MPPRLIGPNTPLHEARAWLFHRAERGVNCPCCHQYYKEYRRKLTSVPARVLIVMSKRPRPGRFVHIPTLTRKRLPDLADQGGYRTLSVHWGLIEEELTLRPDGGRAGWWRITDLGLAYVHEEAKIQKYAILCDSQCLGFDGPMVSIRDALGTKFDLEDLMRGE